MRFGAIIFDFDGVIADSEALANRVLAEHVTALGLPTTLEQALERYVGRRWPEAMALIESALGRPLPADFSDRLAAATLECFRAELREVPGATAFIRRWPGLPRCIASSSSIGRLTLCLDKLGLTEHFAGAVFSADMVERGKPHPDIFLYAAQRLGVEPARCLVIEDSPSGIRAAKAAGMTVVGLAAASHIPTGHDRRLLEAGADHVATTWQGVSLA
jgi:HAD superfamily hydrolase (TIGR01509 family)